MPRDDSGYLVVIAPFKTLRGPEAAFASGPRKFIWEGLVDP